MIMDGWESDIAEMDAEIKQLKQDCKNLVEVNIIKWIIQNQGI